MTDPNAGRLAGKVALVTGSGSGSGIGIGKAAAIQFAREGAAVAVAGRREAPVVGSTATVPACFTPNVHAH